MQLYDPRTNGFSPSTQGIGMHVEIRDPDDKIILSKVRGEKKNRMIGLMPDIFSNFMYDLV